MKYVYPAIFSPIDEGYQVEVPDLPGLITFGTDLSSAIEMARDAIEMWLWDAENKSEPIPSPTKFNAPDGCFVNWIDADTDAYRIENDNRAVKKTLTIPSWLNSKAEKAGVNFSQTLQEALKDRLGLQ